MLSEFKTHPIVFSKESDPNFKVLCGFEDSVLSHRNRFQYDYPLKHMCKVVDGTDAYEVTNKFFKH